ncbi:MAG: rane protein [Frankiales bacterium]|nr:rane protein [Frankiales bacterium]
MADPSSRNRSAVALVQASHPEPSLAVTGITTALAVSSGLGPRSALVAAAFLTGQLSVGWSNDWIDAARDRGSSRSDKPVARGELRPETVRGAALIALALCVPLSLALGPAAGSLHLLAVAAAWAYNARLKSSVLSFAPYALAFGAVPSIVTLALDDPGPAPAWATAAGALLGVGAHLCNVLPDLEDDLATGVRGLPHRLGPRMSGGLAAVLLLAAATLLAIGPGRPGAGAVLTVAVAASVTAGGLLLGRRPGSRAPFRAALVVAALCVGLLLARGAVLAPG